MTGSTLSLSPEFAGQAGAEPEATPMMEGVRSAFHKAGGIGSEIVDIAMSPAARPWMGGLMGIIALTLAWKFMPMLTDKIVPGNGMMSRLGSGLLALGLSLGVGMGAFEFGSTGFDTKKTIENMGRNLSIAGDMAGSALGGADNLLTGGRVGETFGAAGRGLVAADDATGNVVSTVAGATVDVAGAGIDLAGQGLSAAGEAASDVGEAALNGYDRLIDHKPGR